MATEDQKQQEQEQGAQQNDATQQQGDGTAAGSDAATAAASKGTDATGTDTGATGTAAGADAAGTATGSATDSSASGDNAADQQPAQAPAPQEPAAAPVVPAPAPAPAVKSAPAPKAAPAPAPVVAAPTTVADAINAAAPGNSPVPFYETPGLSRNGSNWLRRLNEYMEAMRAGLPVDVEEGKAWQKVLYRTLMNVIHNSDDAEFSVLLKIILDQFVVHKDGVFHPSHSMRFAEHIELNEAERATFFNLVDLLTISADAKGRELRLRQVDLNKSLTSEFTEQGKQRIRAFLGKK